VTTGADGLARTWDVREACLKRYGHMIGHRAEYNLRLDGKDVSSGIITNGNSAISATRENETDHSVQLDTVSVPPLPVRVDDRSENADAAEPPQAPPPPIPAPPLPLPPAGDAFNLMPDNAAENNDEGLFVANDVIDEGVKLISKLQHGATLEERLGGPGTRARRSAVKVICIARCPYGGHFATGSDDGICRVWHEEDNSSVELVDARFCRTSFSVPAAKTYRQTRTVRRK